MISHYFDRMISNLRPPEDFVLFRRSDMLRLPARTVDLFLNAAASLGDVPEAGLEDWLESPAGYDRLRTATRTALRTLVFAEVITQNGKYLPDAAVLLYRILREPAWNAANRHSIPLRAAGCDLYAAQTAELIAWTLMLLDDPLEKYAPGIMSWAREECIHRFLNSLEEPSCCEAILRTADAPLFARAAAVTAILLPQDGSQRWLRLKNALRIAERSVSFCQDAYNTSGLSLWCRYAAALADTVFLTDLACDGRSGMREDPDLRSVITLPVLTHITGGFFVDGRSDMEPELRGDDLYRIGAAFDDDRLCALGAALSRRTPEPDCGTDVTGILLNALWRASMEDDTVLPNEDPLVVCREIGLYGARSSGRDSFYAALHNGALIVYLNGEPVLTEGSEGAITRSLPEPDGMRQIRQQCSDITVRTDGFPSIGMNLAPTFPMDAGISSWQRTLLLTGATGSLRLLDVFDFAGRRHTAAMRFTSHRDIVLATGGKMAHIGNAYLSWDGPSLAKVEDLPGGMHALVLSSSGPVTGACWTCVITPD